MRRAANGRKGGAGRQLGRQRRGLRREGRTVPEHLTPSLRADQHACRLKRACAAPPAWWAERRWPLQRCNSRHSLTNRFSIVSNASIKKALCAARRDILQVPPAPALQASSIPLAQLFQRGGVSRLPGSRCKPATPEPSLGHLPPGGELPARAHAPSNAGRDSMRAATLLLLVLAAGPALTAAAAEPPLWGALSPGAATATDATQFLQALDSGVGDITLTGAHCCLAGCRCRCRPPAASLADHRICNPWNLPRCRQRHAHARCSGAVFPAAHRHRTQCHRAGARPR